MVISGRISQFIFLFLIVFFVTLMLYLARKGKVWGIRKIPSLDALEEIIGRCVEMGRPLIAATGTGNLQNLQTIAGMSILTWVHKLAARYGVEMSSLLAKPEVYSIMEEQIREIYILEGKSEEFKPETVRFLGGGASGANVTFASGALGIMHREKVGGSIMVGSWAMEALLLAENARIVGAMQLCGTAQFAQLPFFIAVSDYVLIGEELYAAGAYTSGDPQQIASLNGQDISRVMLVIILIIGLILATMGRDDILIDLLSL